MSDLIAIMRARFQERQARDEELRNRLKELETLLREAGGEKTAPGSSKNCTLQEYGDGDYYYGHLNFDGTLLIAYRTTEDDLVEQDDQHGNFHIMDLDRCDPAWLRALAVPSVMDSLATSLIANFETEIAASVRGARSVEAMANLPLRELEVGIIDVAMKLGYGKVLEQWRKAQAALAVDPPEALTRASQLIETLCKHILDSKKQPVKGAPDIQDLFKAATKVLDLTPDPKAEEALTRMSSGLVTVVLNIGTLRNHSGIAHGATPKSEPVTFSQARLAVNAAGVLATFMMDAMLQLGTEAQGSDGHMGGFSGTGLRNPNAASEQV